MNVMAQIRTEDSDSTSGPVESRGFIRSYLLAGIGIVLVFVAAIGVLLPGIPTVGPLLLASFFFTKSCPWLEERLIRNRFFAKYLPYLDGTEEMTPKARIATIATMWASISISCLVLLLANQSIYTIMISLLIVLSGLVGTVFIWRFGRKSP